MFSYLFRLFSRIPRAAWESWCHVDAFLGIMVVIVAVGNISLGNHLDQWIGLHPVIVLKISAAVAAYLLLRSAYEDHRALQEMNDRLNVQIESLTKNSQPRVTILGDTAEPGWGKHYRITVYNTGKSRVDVTVAIVEMYPQLAQLPLPLYLQVTNLPNQQEFRLNGDTKQQVDVFRTFLKEETIIRFLGCSHQPDAPKREYRLLIRASTHDQFDERAFSIQRNGDLLELIPGPVPPPDEPPANPG